MRMGGGIREGRSRPVHYSEAGIMRGKPPVSRPDSWLPMAAAGVNGSPRTRFGLPDCVTEYEVAGGLAVVLI